MKSLWLLLCLLGAVSIAVIAQSNSAQNPVEIKGEPRHHPKFENEFLRVWDMTVPPGDATLWHAHRNDNVVVTLADAKLHIETVGRDPVDADWKFGEVRFSKATYVHRAMNVGGTSFHNLTIELLKPSGVAVDLASLPKTAREPILDNDRVRVYRVSLAPGEQTPMHTHPWPGLAVAVTGGDLEVITQGRREPERLLLQASDVRWRAGAVTHSLKNVGKSPIEGIDIELK